MMKLKLRRLSLSRGTIHTIIHDHLKKKKVTSRWVLHELNEKNLQDRVRICRENLAKIKDNKWRLGDIITGDESWFYHRQIGEKQLNRAWVNEGEAPRTVVKRDRFEPKTIFCIFFKRSGPMHISYLERGETIDHKSYLNCCLKPIIKELIRRRPIEGAKNMKFHHDNARPHVHQAVITFLNDNKLILMDHPPYSPDLAPSDFWLFDYIKTRLHDHGSAESLNRRITEIVNYIDENEWKKTFDKWIERMEMCVKNKGHYFEHLLK